MELLNILSRLIGDWSFNRIIESINFKAQVYGKGTFVPKKHERVLYYKEEGEMIINDIKNLIFKEYIYTICNKEKSKVKRNT